jgi:hypothetical protein
MADNQKLQKIVATQQSGRYTAPQQDPQQE